MAERSCAAGVRGGQGYAVTDDPLDHLARDEQRQQVHRLVELRAQAWEEDLGRAPTPEELERLYYQAEENVAFWSFRMGALAKAEAEAGRPLTLDEKVQIDGRVRRDWESRLPE